MQRLATLVAMTVVFAVVPAIAAATASTPSRRVPESCWSGYSYNGVQSDATSFGLSGTITLLEPFVVASGHAAAWIGVGGLSMGPQGSDEWLQAGIARDAGGPDVLYYEFKRPDDEAATFVRLQTVRPGRAHSIVIYERARHPGTWRVAIDGVKVGDPIDLPGSHGRFEGVATAESWDGGEAGACNQYAVGFSGLAVRTQFAGTWRAFRMARVLRDPAYRLTLRASGFVAESR